MDIAGIMQAVKEALEARDRRIADLEHERDELRRLCERQIERIARLEGRAHTAEAAAVILEEELAKLRENQAA